MRTKPPLSPMLIDKRRKSDNLVLIKSIKNDLRRILAKRNSLSLTDLNDDDEMEQIARGGGVMLNHAHVDKKTARSLSTIPTSTNGGDRVFLRSPSPKWIKRLSTKATKAIKKSIENMFFG